MVTADAQYFWANHVTTPALVAEYTASGEDPHRAWVLEGLAALGPERAVLEVGCHCGPLMRRIQQTYPSLRVFGLDVNAAVVAQAQQDGLHAAVGSAPETLARYDPQMFDVVVSSYCLAYVDPCDLPTTLASMMRIARLGLVVAEPMAGPGVPTGERSHEHYVEWRHDYLDALDLAADQLDVQVTSTRTRKGPHAGINGVVVAKLTWRS